MNAEFEFGGSETFIAFAAAPLRAAQSFPVSGPAGGFAQLIYEHEHSQSGGANTLEEQRSPLANSGSRQ